MPERPAPVALPPGFLRAPLAHRALHDRARGRVENSLAAVRAAIAAGYGLEIDIQPARDGVPMVFHDYDLGRLTAARGPVARRPSAELGAIRLTDSDECIPTLASVLALVAGQVPLLIEIKDQDGGLGPGVGALETAVAADLAGYGGPVAVMSFNPHSVAAMATAAPHLPRGITTSAYRADDWPLIPPAVRDRLRAIPDYAATGASFISHEAGDLGRGRVQALRDAGAVVLCWTVRTPEAETAARRVAHNITFEGYRAPIPA